MPVLPAILPLLIATNGYSYLEARLLVTAYNVTSSCYPAGRRLALGHEGFLCQHQYQSAGQCSIHRPHGSCKELLPDNVLCNRCSTGPCMFSPRQPEPGEPFCVQENRGRITSFFVVGGNFGYAIGWSAGALVFWLRLPGLFLVFPAIFMIVALSYVLPGDIAGACISCPTRNPYCWGQVEKAVYYRVSCICLGHGRFLRNYLPAEYWFHRDMITRVSKA